MPYFCCLPRTRQGPAAVITSNTPVPYLNTGLFGSAKGSSVPVLNGQTAKYLPAYLHTGQSLCFASFTETDKICFLNYFLWCSFTLLSEAANNSIPQTSVSGSQTGSEEEEVSIAVCGNISFNISTSQMRRLAVYSGCALKAKGTDRRPETPLNPVTIMSLNHISEYVTNRKCHFPGRAQAADIKKRSYRTDDVTLSGVPLRHHSPSQTWLPF